MKIGTREFDVRKHCYLMGILNITPDSFSDGGSYTTLDLALKRVEEMISEGMDVLDIGGESTRPGFSPVDAQIEMSRVMPVIEAVKKNFDIPISLDTYRSETAEAGINAGVDLINDIWGLQQDEKMAPVIAKSGVACCLMHNRKEAVYQNFAEDIVNDMEQIILTAKEAGIGKDRIILDPGIGFAKSYEQNLETMARLSEFKQWGYPVLLGTSRKSMIGITLDQAPATDRLEGTLATTAYAVGAGCAFVRVHDIKANKRVIRMMEAILHAKE